MLKLLQLWYIRKKITALHATRTVIANMSFIEHEIKDQKIKHVEEAIIHYLSQLDNLI